MRRMHACRANPKRKAIGELSASQTGGKRARHLQDSHKRAV